MPQAVSSSARRTHAKHCAAACISLLSLPFRSFASPFTSSLPRARDPLLLALRPCKRAIRALAGACSAAHRSASETHPCSCRLPVVRIDFISLSPPPSAFHGFVALLACDALVADAAAARLSPNDLLSSGGGCTPPYHEHRTEPRKSSRTTHARRHGRIRVRHTHTHRHRRAASNPRRHRRLIICMLAFLCWTVCNGPICR